MLIYVVAPPIFLAVMAFIPAAVIGFASRAARRADWLEEQAAAEAADAEIDAEVAAEE